MDKQPTLAIANFPGSRFTVEAFTTVLTFADLGLGNDSMELIETPLSLSTQPLLLPGEAHPEVLNRALIASEAVLFHPEQHVACWLLEPSALSPADVMLLRFMNREVAWARRNATDLLDRSKPSWKTVIETLHANHQLSQWAAKQLFGKEVLTLVMQRELCGRRISEQSICEYRRQLDGRPRRTRKCVQRSVSQD